MCGNILFHSPLASSRGIHREFWRQSQEKASDRLNKNPAKHVNFKIPEETRTEIHPIQTDTEEGLPNKKIARRRRRRRRNPGYSYGNLSLAKPTTTTLSTNLITDSQWIHSIHQPILNIKNQGEKLVENFKIPERNQNWYTSPTERKAFWKPFLQLGSKQKSA